MVLSAPTLSRLLLHGLACHSLACRSTVSTASARSCLPTQYPACLKMFSPASAWSRRPPHCLACSRTVLPASARSCLPPHGLACLHTVSPASTLSCLPPHYFACLCTVSPASASALSRLPVPPHCLACLCNILLAFTRSCHPGLSLTARRGAALRSVDSKGAAPTNRRRCAAGCGSDMLPSRTYRSPTPAVPASATLPEPPAIAFGHSQEDATPLDPRVSTRVALVYITLRSKERPRLTASLNFSPRGFLSIHHGQPQARCARSANLAAPATIPGAPNDPGRVIGSTPVWPAVHRGRYMAPVLRGDTPATSVGPGCAPGHSRAAPHSDAAQCARHPGTYGTA